MKRSMQARHTLLFPGVQYSSFATSTLRQLHNFIIHGSGTAPPPCRAPTITAQRNDPYTS